MNPIRVKISNYRNIPYNHPLEFEIKDGITFILGTNNVGKSNLLKIFFEFKRFFSFDRNNLSNRSQNSGNLYFDHISNRKNIDKPIIIRFSQEDIYVEYTITRNGNALHTNNLTISYKCSFSPNENNKVDRAQTMMDLIQKSMYIGASRNVLTQTNSDYFDIQIGTSFFHNWSQWTGGQDFQKMQKINSLIKELGDLFEYETFDIKVNDTKNNLIITTDEGIFTLDELGSGISHFIIVLGNALIKEPNLILIDEPETGLHPKLQQKFLIALAKKAKIATIATSHSIGLARSTADRILSLTKDNDGKSKLIDYGETYHPSLANSISELGYSQFIELGGENILLVEGRTDIKCFKEILRKYGIEHHFIIMDLGGAGNINGKSLEELSELKRLNANSYSVIFDSEFQNESDTLKTEFEEFLTNCKSLGFNVFPTDYHSTENYIT